MRRTLRLVAGTLLFFAIATLPIKVFLGDEHVRAHWAAGTVCLLVIALGGLVGRLGMAGFQAGLDRGPVLAPAFRFMMTLASLLVVPPLFGIDLQVYGAWVILWYFVLLMIESIGLANQQDGRPPR